MKLYCCVFALLLATDINSCDDRGAKIRILEMSRKTEQACKEAGGVPIFQTNKDFADGTYFDTVIRCDFPDIVRTLEGR